MTKLATSLSVDRLLDSHLPHHADASWYRAPCIPAKKLHNALGKYASSATAESVLALGDGTVFGSAKEGIVITTDMLYSHTSEETFSIPLRQIANATEIGGWPNYGVELQSHDGSTHRILTICFDKNQDSLVTFLNAIAENNSAPVVSQEPSPMVQFEPSEVNETPVEAIPVCEGTPALKRIEICFSNGSDDVGSLFNSAFPADAELPLLKSYCRYIGHAGREVDAVVLLTNRRMKLFSMERGSKIVLVELIKSLLGKVPFPFFDKVVCFFLFSIPRSIYVALQGGKEQMISQALGHDERELLSTNPPLRKVQEFSLAQLAESVESVEIGPGVCTGILARKFGVTFAPAKLAKTFSVPKDLILPDYESPVPFEQLLYAIRPTLTGLGLGYRLDAAGKKLTIVSVASELEAAA